MMTDSGRRVLVLDGDQASSYAIVRSLFRHGLKVDVADCCDVPLAARSKWCHESFRYPPPKVDPKAFLTWLKERISETAYAYVIPVTDDTLQVISAHRDEFPDSDKFALAPLEAHEICSNKAETFALAEKLGLDVPSSVVVKSVEDGLNQPFDFPVVVKPNRSVALGADESRHALNVRYAHSETDLKTLLKENLPYGSVILQEYAQGVGCGVEVLVDHGEVVAAFQHERLHEWPLTGGGSSYRHSVALDAKMLDAAKQLMAAINYHGVAMVEFKFDAQRDKRWLMEINGRFWGSLPLCIHAGADFPKWLFDLDVDGKRPESSEYRVGVRSRKFSRDLFWAVEVLRKTDPNPLIRWPKRSSGLLTWFGILHPRHRFDVQNFADIAPGWHDFKSSISLLVSRFTERSRRLKILEEMKAMRGNTAKLGETLNGVKSILFLCYGNINRSALAEFDFMKRDVAHLGIDVKSAGFHQKTDRPADATMLRLADEHDIDLSPSRSSCINQDMLRDADLILAMDVTHVVRIREEHPEVAHKCVLMPVFNPSSDADIQIADPYGGTPEVYESCLKSVLDANSGLVAALQNRHPG